MIYNARSFENESREVESMSTDRYVSPLSERYASKEMQYIFSPDMKFRTWRRLWIALAETEKELGLNITQEQIDELKAHADDINYDVAKAREKEVRHDVMSHVYAYGVQCPKAKGIIHLGATSCYVGDNTDIIVMTEALKLVRKKLLNVIAELAKFADANKNLPTLAFTHFQPAQPTTVGKRATLWMQEFMMESAKRHGLTHTFLALYLNGDNLYPRIRFSPPIFGEEVINRQGKPGRWYKYWSETAQKSMTDHVGRLMKTYGENLASIRIDGRKRYPLCSMWDPLVAMSFEEEGRDRYVTFLRKKYGVCLQLGLTPS